LFDIAGHTGGRKRREDMSEHTEVKKIFADLMKNHCCKYACRCEKFHLYCGYELDHGIELQEVINIIEALENETR